MNTLWKFLCNSFEGQLPFYLEPDVLFLGNKEQAMEEAERRSAKWDEEHDYQDVICSIVCMGKNGQIALIPDPENFIAPFGFEI